MQQATRKIWYLVVEKCERAMHLCISASFPMESQAFSPRNSLERQKKASGSFNVFFGYEGFQFD